MARPHALLLRARRAFALPTVILVMLVLVGALASGFGMLSSERGADDAAIQSQAAAALAETGLSRGFGTGRDSGSPRCPAPRIRCASPSPVATPIS